MKRGYAALSALVSFIVLVSSSVWEGAAGVAAGTDTPSGGLYIATNAFSVNSRVELTNMENERTVRVTVVSPLESPGLLALVSREAADAIGIPGRMVVRVRLSQATDPASRSTGSDLISGDPDFDPEAFVALNNIMREEPRPALSTETEWSNRLESGELIVDMPRDMSPSAPVLMPAQPQAVPMPPIVAPPQAAPLPPTVPSHTPIPPDYTLTFVPAPPRPPESTIRPDPAFIIPPLAAISPSPPSSVYIDPTQVIPPVHTPPPAAVQRRIEPPVFPVPIVTSLEPGRYYLQLVAFSREDSMRNELAKFSNQIPRQVMNVGTPESPLFRLLIGPLTQGESEAYLFHFRSVYPDAFIRFGR